MTEIVQGEGTPRGADGNASRSSDRDAVLTRGKRTSFILTAILFVVALSFVLSGAFLTSWMTRQVMEGLTIAMVFLAFVLTTATALMAVYVYWADRQDEDIGGPRRMEIP